jgi:hypothetical protein
VTWVTGLADSRSPYFRASPKHPRGAGGRKVRRRAAKSLNRRALERQFALPAVELKEIVALDDMELVPEMSSVKIRSRDLHGPLPEIILRVDVDDSLGALDRLGRETVKLCTTRFRSAPAQGVHRPCIRLRGAD